MFQSGFKKKQTGFGLGTGGNATGGSSTSPTKSGFGFGNKQQSGFGFGGNSGFKSATSMGTSAPFGGSTGQTSKVGFGFGNKQQSQGTTGFSMQQQQQQQQMQFQQQYVLTEDQKRQNKLDRILEKKSKLESTLPPPGVKENLQTHSTPQQRQPQQQHHRQSQSPRGQNLLRGSHGVGDPSRGRPLSSGIIGSSPSGGHNTSLMSPEVLLGRRAKKLTIDHSKCEDLTEGLPSPYAKLSNHKKNLARSMDQVTGNNDNSSNSASEKKGTKKAKQDVEYATSLSPSNLPVSERLSPLQPQFDVYTSDLSDTSPKAVDMDVDGDKRNNICPLLTKEGYFTRPDMSILQAMSPPELASVPHFTIYVPNIGSITWKQRTDVRGLDLDSIVFIEHKAVTVYPEGTDKPPEGMGLNKSAEITLYNIFPKQNASQSKQLNFVNKLRASNENSDATFESYDRSTGTWIFSTDHFSRHGLSDSDSDDEEEGGDMDVENMPLALQLPESTLKGKNKPGSKKSKSPAKDVDVKSKAKPTAKILPSLSGGAGSRRQDYQSLQRIKENMTSRPVHEDPSETQRELMEKSTAYANLLEASTSYQPRCDDTYDSDVSESTGFIFDDVVPVPSKRTLRKDRFKSAYSISKQAKIDYKPHMAFVEAGKNSCRKMFTTDDSPCLRLMKAVKERHTSVAQLKRPSISCTAMRTVAGGRSQRPIDAALYMGRSFRVGWSSDGKLLHMGNVNFSKLPTDQTMETTHRDDGETIQGKHGVIHLQTIETIGSYGNDSFDVIPRLMKSLKSSSLSVVPVNKAHNRQQVPLWRLPKADVDLWDEYLRFVCLLKQLLDDVDTPSKEYDRNHPCWIISRIISLVDAIFGQEVPWITKFKSTGVSDYMMPLNESQCDSKTILSETAVALWERRRQNISNWLKSVCEDDLDEKVENIVLSDRPESVILSLLCAGRVEDAVEYSEKAGMFRLAMLLSQAESDDEFRFMVLEQVSLWEENNATDLIPEDLLSIHKILGGVYDDEDSVLALLDWPNAVGVIFWYCNASLGKFSDALLNYDEVRRENKNIRHPLLRDEDLDFEDLNEAENCVDDSEAEALYHGLYRLLDVYFFQQPENFHAESIDDLDRKAIASLRPRGFSSDMLDYRGSYLALLFLEATSVVQQGLRGSDTNNCAHAAAIVRQHMVGQLLSQGEWAWAVFVCMQIEDPVVRSYAVRDLVLRFGGNFEGQDVSLADQLSLIKNHFHVPDSLILEASAYQHSYSSERNDEANDLHMCGLWREAATLICREIAPRAMFDSSATEALVLPLLQDLADRHNLEGRDIDEWNLRGGSLLSYFDIKERALSMDQMEYGDSNSISELVEDAACLLEQLTDNTFGLFRSNSPSSSRRDYRLLSNVVVNDMGTFLFRTIIRYWACDSSLILRSRLAEFIRHAPILEDYRSEVCRLFPALEQE